MNEKTIEALKLALEALKMCRGLIRNNIENLVPIASPNPWFSQDVDHAITAIREALAEQPAQQQEPVASLLVGRNSYGRYMSITTKAHTDTLPLGEYKLYTSPPANPPSAPTVLVYTSPPASKPWVGLSHEAVWSLYKNLWMFHPAEEPRLAGDILKFARAIEAKLREKNNG